MKLSLAVVTFQLSSQIKTTEEAAEYRHLTSRAC